jgi:hypothetical protein
MIENKFKDKPFGFIEAESVRYKLNNMKLYIYLQMKRMNNK